MSQDDGQEWRAPNSARPSEPPADSPWAVPGGSRPAPAGPPSPPPGSTSGPQQPSAPAAPPAGVRAPGPGGYVPPGGHGATFQRPTEPRPGIIALRPVSMSEIFNGGFSYIRRNPRATLGLSVLVMALASALESYSAAIFVDDTVTLMRDMMIDPTVVNQEPEPLSTAGIWSTVGSVLLTLFASMILTGLLTLVASRAVLGATTTLGKAWRGVRGRLPAVMAVTLLVTLGVVLVSAVAAALLALVTELLGGGWAGFLISLVVTLPVLGVLAWLYIKFVLAVPVVVLERLGPIAALGRSWRLVRGSWWRVMFIILLATILILFIQQLLMFPFTIGAGVISWIGVDTAWALPASTAVLFLGTLLLVVLTYPFLTGVTSLLYLDLRMRREGLDLRLQTVYGSEEPLTEEVFLPIDGPEVQRAPGAVE